MKTKLLLINASANTGSTGRIAEEIGLKAQIAGYDVRFAYGRVAINSKLPLIKIGAEWDVQIHGIKSRLWDAHGFASLRATKALVEELKQWKPNIINIHNLHGYYIHIGILFEYLKEVQIPVIWTFHDCWPFTGHCSFFDRYDCRKWETECHKCPNRKGYPESWFFDRSKSNFNRKKELFNGLSRLTIVTPSAWLAQHVKRSFLSNYSVDVIHNGLNLAVFNLSKETSVLNKYGIADDPFVLGVASIWDKRKGLDDFVSLRQSLSKDIQLVLVGLSADQTAKLPDGIISIPRTENQQELAALYSAASVFVNPTYVDNFPTTNIEALACGTPVITYRTGGSPEAVNSETGVVIETGDVAALRTAIDKVVSNGKHLYSSKCRERAEKLFNKEERYQEYLEMFAALVK